MRGRNLIFTAAMANPSYYSLWVRAAEPRLGSIARDDNIATPRVAVIIVRGADEISHEVMDSAASAHAAFGQNVVIIHQEEVKNASDFRALLTSIEDRCDWLIPLVSGDVLAPEAGTCLSGTAKEMQDVSILYWDEDRLDRGRRYDPWLKPDWDPLFYLSHDGLEGACMLRMGAVLEALPTQDECSLSTGLLAQIIIDVVARSWPDAIVHIPRILVHRRNEVALLSEVDRAALLNRHWNERVHVITRSETAGVLQLRFPTPPAWPSVAIIIPTRDKLALLRRCLEGVDCLDYAGDIEITIVDNGSIEPETIDFLSDFEKERGRVLRRAGAFNFASLNNEAARRTVCDYLLLLNNDVEMVDDQWLSNMMRLAVRQGTGAVGALLLYPDWTVQHAGVAIGVGGAAGHVYRGQHLCDVGHHFMHRTTRRVSVVTAACMLVSREAYEAVGGLDEVNFAVAFNDVDFCLRLQKAGYHNVFCADAVLIHHESKSRGSDMSSVNFERYSRELAALQARWHTQTAVDPFHHPLFYRPSEAPVLAL